MTLITPCEKNGTIFIVKFLQVPIERYVQSAEMPHSFAIIGLQKRAQKAVISLIANTAMERR